MAQGGATGLIRQGMTRYDRQFYENLNSGAHRSARKMLDYLFAVYRPETVVDFGCGHGAWLDAAHQLGAKRVIGYDGEWVDRERLVSSAIEFHVIDFRSATAVETRADMAISVEVAEHFGHEFADRFVAMIARSADLVVFGAAIPGQGGVDHVNERYPSYWTARFDAAGFDVVDFFRPHFWHDEDIEYWYRQNTLLFVRRARIGDYPWLGGLERNPALIDVVHPKLLARKLPGAGGRERADVLRDCALAVEKEDPFLALQLMAMALRERPNGPFIRERYERYLEALRLHPQRPSDAQE